MDFATLLALLNNFAIERVGSDGSLMAGARRQTFVVFAGFMMVEKFGFSVQKMTGLFGVNLVANILCAPIIWPDVARFGKKLALNIEHAGLVLVFLAYGGLFWFGLVV